MTKNATVRLFSLSRRFLFGLSIIALTTTAQAGAGQWTSTGPVGAVAYSFALDPSAPSRVFALSVGGLLRSTDGGVSWTNVNSQISGLYALAIGPFSALYAIDFVASRVVRSEDGGITWQFLALDLPADDRPLSLAVDQTSPTLYVGTLTGVFRSTDGGQTWAGTAGIPELLIEALAIDPSNSSTVYAAAIAPSGSAGRVFKSTDAGRNFAVAGASALSLEGLAVDPSQPATVYGCGDSGILRSLDGGATWTSALSGTHAYAIAIDPTETSRLYATTNGGFIRGHAGEAAWSPVRFGPGDDEDLQALAVTIVPSSPSAVLVAGRDGILRSTDGGASWTVAEVGGGSSILSVAVNPTALGSVYAGGKGGVFESSNAGTTWTPPDLATPETFALAVDPKNPSTVFAAGRGLSKSQDGGATWESTGTGLSPAVLFTALAISPSDPSVMLAGSVAGVLYKSSDGGQSFQQAGPVPVDDAGYPPLWRSIAFDPSNPSIAYVAGDPAAYFGEHGFVLKTLDGGTHWSNLGVGGSGAFSIVVDPESPSTVYLATREGLLKSTVGGGSWIPLAGPTGTLVVDPVEPHRIFSGGTSGVFESLDGGTSWSALGPGLTGEVTSLAMEPNGKRLYAGTSGSGVFDFDLSLEGQGPCEPGPGTLCLLGGRFRVTLFVTDSRRDRSSSGLAVAQGDRFGYFSLPAFTGDPTLPEVFIKMVDGSSLPHGSFWVFYNGLTSLPYTLVVTDTSTGARRTYQSAGLCGAADTSAFPAGSAFPQTGAVARPVTTLTASGNALSLLGGRFQITLSATQPRDGRVTGGSAIAGGDRFGYFSLPDFTRDPSLPEVFVKMVDATSFTGYFWFFHSGLTHLPYTLTVTDTVTGAVRTYQNDSSSATRLCGGADTKAFPE